MQGVQTEWFFEINDKTWILKKHRIALDIFFGRSVETSPGKEGLLCVVKVKTARSKSVLTIMNLVPFLAL